MRLSECLVIWSQTFSLCVGFVFIAYFASFTIPYSLSSFPLPSQYFTSFPPFSFVTLSPSVNLFCCHFFPSSFLTLLYVSKYRHYMSTIGSNGLLSRYVVSVFLKSLSCLLQPNIDTFRFPIRSQISVRKGKYFTFFYFYHAGSTDSCAVVSSPYVGRKFPTDSLGQRYFSPVATFMAFVRETRLINFTQNPTTHINKLMM